MLSCASPIRLLCLCLIGSLALGACLPDDEEDRPCSGTVWACEELTVGGWCLEQEGCTTEPRCVPDASACDGYNEAECSQQPGCDWILSCGGVATQCEWLLHVEACNAQLGCFFQNDEHRCYGQQVYCEELTHAQCSSQNGCAVTGSCEVVSTCVELDQEGCAQQATCQWGEGCAGEATGCQNLEVKSACEYQAGCQWL